MLTVNASNNWPFKKAEAALLMMCKKDNSPGAKGVGTRG